VRSRSGDTEAISDFAERHELSHGAGIHELPRVSVRSCCADRTQYGISAVALMRPPPFWAAVRLVVFANLSVSRANYQTFWWWFGIPRERRRKVSVLWWIAGHLTPPRSGRAPRGESTRKRDDLWLSFVRGVVRYEKGRCPDAVFQLRSPQDAAETTTGDWTSSDWPLRPWPPWDTNRSRLHYIAFKRLHTQTRARLATICDRQTGDRSALLTELTQYCSPGLRFRWKAGSGNRGALVQECGRESLAAHLDGLFVRTWLAGLWDDFYQCPQCGSFGVKKLHGKRRTRSCGSSSCRSKLNRARRRAAKRSIWWRRA
jgi:hypothetical protein